jgi:predicted  nucleic acid-binding Zn-ribbon protein
MAAQKKKRISKPKRVTLVSLDRRLEAHDQRFDAIDQRFDAIDQRFEAIDRRFDAADTRVDRLEKQLDAKIDDAVHTLRAEMRQGFAAVDAKFVEVDRKLADLPLMKQAILDIAGTLRDMREETRQTLAKMDKKAEQERLEALERRVDVLEAKAS